MISILTNCCESAAEVKYVSSLDEMYTDFDAWLFKFNAVVLTKSCSNTRDVKYDSLNSLLKNLIASNEAKKLEVLPSQERSAKGILLDDNTAVKIECIDTRQNIENFVNIFKENGDLASYDLILLRLVESIKPQKNICNYYIRSKL